MPEANAPVTFLLTDVEGSTRLWQSHPIEMSAATHLLDETVERVVTASAGRLIKARGEGDSHFCVFDDPRQAVVAAVDLQLELAATSWPTSEPIQVRASIHTGRAEFRGIDFYGTEVNRAARIRSLAHGGQTLVSNTTLALVSGHLPPNVTLRDLGVHALKDFADPEQVFQLSHPALPSDFPPLMSVQRPRHNLPIQTTSFVGRGREMEELEQLVRDHRLVTIVGSGGSGKSRIAIEAGHELVDRFGDGVWFVELAAVENEANVARTLADVLRAPERTDVGIQEALVDFLRARALLLVIDNAEHVIDSVAVLVEQVLRTCEDVHVVVTTREALRLDGEHVWPLGPLAIVDIDDLPPLDVLATSEAVQLFVDRTKQLQPVFALTAGNARPIVEICNRLGGIPLAIELATARVPSLGVDRVAARLDDVFRVLTGGRRTALPRHRTLRATIDWSYDLLEDSERQLLERLSVFVGGCTLDAAEAVCSGDTLAAEDVAELISSLVAKSLVGTDGSSGEVRYRLLETVRQYATEKLAASRAMRQIRDRHLQWFASLARAHPPRWVSGLGRPATQIRRFWADIGNLHTAVAWAADEGSHDLALSVSIFLTDIQINKGQRENPERLLLDAVERDLPAADLAHATLQIYVLRYNEHDLKSKYLDKALELARASGVRDVTFACLAWEGDRSLALGNLDQAQAAWRELLTEARAAEDDDWTAKALVGLGEIARMRGAFDDALAMHAEALALARDPVRRTEALHRLAYHRERLDDFAGAAALLENAVEVCIRAGYESEAAGILAGELAIIKAKQHRPAEARDAMVTAEAIAERGEDLAYVAQVQWYRGWFELADGRIDDAKLAFERSMQGFADLRSTGAEWDVRCALALVALEAGDRVTARRIVQEALRTPAAGAAVQIQLCVLLGLGEISMAEDLVKQALHERGEIPGSDTTAYTPHAWLTLYQEQYEESIRHFQDLIAFYIARQRCRALDSGLLAGLAAAHLGAGNLSDAARAVGASGLLWHGGDLSPWGKRPIAAHVQDACRAELGDAELDRLVNEGRRRWYEDRLALVMSGRPD